MYYLVSKATEFINFVMGDVFVFTQWQLDVKSNTYSGNILTLVLLHAFATRRPSVPTTLTWSHTEQKKLLIFATKRIYHCVGRNSLKANRTYSYPRQMFAFILSVKGDGPNLIL